MSAITLDHHVHDDLTNTWSKCPSSPQPIISLSISIHSADYASLSVNKRGSNICARISCIADTGCQSCQSGTRILSLLKLSRKDLIPVTMTMRAANRQRIPILGALIVRLQGHESSRSTKQMVYITSSSDKFFLSRDACAALGIISRTFPSVEECSSTIVEPAGVEPHPCSCPPRRKPPPRPTAPPFPAIEANRERLQNGYWTTTHLLRSTHANTRHSR